MRDPFLVKVQAALDPAGIVRKRKRVSLLTAVSGGADSVALLAALVALQDGRWQLGVAHVNHKLRGADSEADEEFVVRLAKKLGVPAFIVEGRVEPGANLEERARERRYARLADIAEREGFRAIATAHTVDDQAETVLLRLLRGAGTTGLSGIAPERRDGIIRPLLRCTRTEVLEFLSRRGLRFRRDLSNRSLRFTRNRIRRLLLPRLAREFNPAIRETLARTAELLRDDEAFLEEVARRAAGRSCSGLRLDGRRLARLALALQRRVVRLWLTARRGSLRAIGAEHVEQIRALAVAEQNRGRLSVPGGVVSRSRGFLIWGEIPQTRKGFRRGLLPGRSIDIAGWRIRFHVETFCGRRPVAGPWRAIFDGEALGKLQIEIRSAAPGDRVRPLGLGGSKKLQDVFVDAKVPREERAGWPVVHQGQTILWVPGLVRCETGTVTRYTRRLVVLDARRT